MDASAAGTAAATSIASPASTGGASSPAAASSERALNDPRNFINRELSTLAFEKRVLEEASDPSVPLFERLKFLAIVSANLDEFFMIRVAGLKQQSPGQVEETGPDGMSPAEQLQEISQRCHDLMARQERVLLDEVLPELAKAGVHLISPESLTAQDDAFLTTYFEEQVLPILTPIALDPSHPFPHLRNKAVNLAIRFGGATDARLRYGVVPVPGVLPRMVQLPTRAATSYVLLERVIARNVGALFPGMPVEGCWPFRVTRNWDLSIDEEEADDLLVTIEREVRKRDRGSAVRLQINARLDEPVAQFLAKELRLAATDVYSVERPLSLSELVPGVLGRTGFKQLFDEPFAQAVCWDSSIEPNALFQKIREQDVLLHHPYDSFEPVVTFIERAAVDPAVLAIKMTLYRAGKDSPIIRALQRAAENGKQVTALVELKARMDEEANIVWARQLEKAGVHVVYGIIGIKTHCKLALVVRRDPEGLRRYVHLGTGNYNPNTARSYSDFSFFTAREEISEDATSLFNLLTGYSKPLRWRSFLVAPMAMRSSLLGLIEQEIKAESAGRIVAKMNALADPEVIQALYRASRAGVDVQLLVRGICCLRPGVAGLSDRIRVTSVVDRFLEHSRVWVFGAGGARKVYLSSADWMPRNFLRRMEIAFPIEDARIKNRIVDEILALMAKDNVKARVLRSDGSYERVVPGAQGADTAPLRSQERLIALALRASAAENPVSFEQAPLLDGRGRAGRKKRRPAPQQP